MNNRITTDAELLASIQRFITQHSLKPSVFGRLAIGDGNLVSDLGKGRSLTLKRANTVCNFMSEYSRKLPTKAKAQKALSERVNPPVGENA